MRRQSVEQAQTVLRCALRQAVKEGIIPYTPTAPVTTPRPVRHGPDPLTSSEIAQLFAVTRKDRLHALWVLLITAGLRIGEASGLTWDEIDLDEGTMQITQAVQRQNGKGVVKVPIKTARSRRPIYLSSSPLQAAQLHHERQLREYEEAGMAWSPSVLVFATLAGAPLDPDYIRQALHRTLAEIGREPIRVHDLRHTCASYYLPRDTYPRKVQELLGHASITLPLNTCSHFIPGTHREIAHLVEDFFPQDDHSPNKEDNGVEAGGEAKQVTGSDQTLERVVSTPPDTPEPTRQSERANNGGR